MWSAQVERHWAGRAWLAGGLGALAVAAIVAVTVALGRAEAFERLLYDPRQADAFRFDRWPSVVAMVAKYFPVGTGFGTFVPVYKVDEPDALLGSTYFNHAHNDYLEVALAGGLPAVLLLLYAAGLVTARALQLTGKARGETRLFARLGLVMVVLLALASVVDYPIRTPALSALFALAAVWAAMPLSRAGQPG